MKPWLLLPLLFALVACGGDDPGPAQNVPPGMICVSGHDEEEYSFGGDKIVFMCDRYERVSQ